MPTDPRMLAFINRTASTLPADAQLAIAGSGADAGDAIDTAQGTQAYADATTQVNYIKQQDHDAQISMWQNAPDEQRAQWVGAGYEPVTAEANAQRSPWSRAYHDVFGAPSALYRQAEKAPYVGQYVGDVGKAGSLVEHGLGAGLRTTQHLYRTGEEYNIDNNGSDNVVTNVGAGIAAIAAVPLSKGAWADAWAKTSRGDQTFNPIKDRDIQSSSGLTPDQIGLAKAAAGSSQDIQDYLQVKKNAGLADEDLTKLAGLLAGDSDAAHHFGDVVQQYKDAKMSFGRSLVPSYLWAHDHQAAEALSGIGDAVFSFTDPTLAAGKALKVFRISKYVVGSLEEYNTKLALGGFQNYAKDVTKYTSVGDAAGLARAHPELNNVNTYLIKHAPQDAEEFTNLAYLPEEANTGVGEASKAKEAAQAQLDLAQANHEKIKAGELPGDIQSPQAVKLAQQNLDIMAAKSQQEVESFLSDNALAVHLANGGGMTISGAPALPNFGLPEQALMKAKLAGGGAIDWMRQFNFTPEDGGRNALGQVITKPVGVVGDLLHKAVTLNPLRGPIDLNDPKSFTRVQQFLEIGLPRGTSDRLLQMWADAPDEGQRKAIWNMIGTQVLKSAGVPQNNDLYKRFAVDSSTGLKNRNYSVNGNDLMDNLDGTSSPAGIYFKQANNLAYMPDFGTIYANAQRGAVTQTVYKLYNNPFMDWAMTNWKKFSLARPGFGIRFASEEVAGAILRDGFFRTIGAQLARGAQQGLEGDTGTHGPFWDLNPIEHSFSVLMRELNEHGADTSKIETAQQLQDFVTAHRTQKFLSATGQKIKPVNDLIDFQQEYPQLFENSLAEEINAQHGMGHNYAGNPQHDTEVMQDGMQKNAFHPTPKVNIKPSGNWIPYLKGSPGHVGMWMKRLDDIASEPAARVVLENISRDDNEIRRAVADELQKPEYEQYWNRMSRGYKTADGRVLGQHATRDDLALDWADKIVNDVKAFTFKHDDNGNPVAPIKGFAEHMLSTRESPEMNKLVGVMMEDRPPVTIGPEYIDAPFGGTGGVLGEWADKLLSRMGAMGNVVSRHPQYLNAAHDAHTALKPIITQILGDNAASHEVLQALVHENAARKVGQFVHRPEVRSQLNVVLTNLLPFQFAQEQFWKRWAKTFVSNPTSFRKAQLAHHALGATGIVHTDDQGEEIFSYPAAGFVQKEITNALDAMHVPATLPIREAFTGQLKMVAPGLDRSFMPSFGPLVSIPMNAVTRMFPELQPTTTKVLGPIATGRPYWEQVLPASLSRFVNTFSASQNNSQSYANAMMKAVQDLAATDNLPYGGFDSNGNPLPMSPAEQQKLMRRVSNWTRVQFLVRASLGLSAPASPEITIGDTKIGQEINMLSSIKGMNLSTAMQQIVHDNPDAYPYEVFLSKGAGSETLPATQAALDSLNKHADFFRGNQKAGGFFLPSTSKDDKFSDEAYKEQLAYGLREHRDVDSFVDQLEYAQASSDYYDTRDQYQKDVKDLKGAAKKQVEDAWSSWKTTYLQQHPMFNDMLTGASAVVTRNRTLTDLRKALADPRLPQGQQTEDIKDLMDTFDQYTADQAQYKGMTTRMASQAKKDQQAAFYQWAVGEDGSGGYLKDHPGATDVFNRLIRPQVEPST